MYGDVVVAVALFLFSFRSLATVFDVADKANEWEKETEWELVCLAGGWNIELLQLEAKKGAGYMKSVRTAKRKKRETFSMKTAIQQMVALVMCRRRSKRNWKDIELKYKH